MLKELSIQNIVLVESAHITFHEGFNVLSGETGSGKSAIMEALHVLMGGRADTSIVRRDSPKGVIEALFDIDQNLEAKIILDQAGVSHESGDDLIIRREILSTGKSRAFVNNQNVQLNLLKELGTTLMEMASQHANQRLLDTGYHLEVIDIYGELENQVATFEMNWVEESKVRYQLDELISNETKRLREIDVCKMELEELNKANIKEDEEETLFAEYSLLNNSEELTKLAQGITETLPLIQQQNRAFEKLASLDPSLKETFDAFKNACLEFVEISHTLHSYQSRHEFNPKRSDEINERLSLINRLKRKYGDPLSYHKELIQRLESLEKSDALIETLRVKLDQIEKENSCLAQVLTKKREIGAKSFEKEITGQLRTLNMAKAEFFVEISPQKRSSKGDDRVEFYLIPNQGEKKVSIRECASGGELSRLMLAIQTLLAGKEQIPTLIFDEIDANIGGETAKIVGEKLCEIGLKHQILCITHFTQVAKCANHHIQISKKEVGGRTLTQIALLDEKGRKAELARMSGE